MSALAMVMVVSAGVDALCRNPNFCVFGREAPVWTGRKWGVDLVSVLSPLPLSLSPCSEEA